MSDRAPVECDELRARLVDLLGEAVRDRAEDPGEASGLGDRYGAVAVFHRGVDLGPRLRGLTQLESGFRGQSVPRKEI